MTYIIAFKHISGYIQKCGHYGFTVSNHREDAYHFNTYKEAEEVKNNLQGMYTEKLEIFKVGVEIRNA